MVAFGPVRGPEKGCHNPAYPFGMPTMVIASPLARSASTRADRIRVGVIGTGFGSTVHIPALQQVNEVDVVAVCSRRPERAHLAAAQHGLRLAVSDHRELIRNP